MKRILSLFVFSICLIMLSICTCAQSADKGELASLLNEFPDPSLYTAESYDIYQQSIDRALIVYEGEGASQEDVNLAITELKAAKEQLVLILNREPLLDYAAQIEEFLYETTYRLSEESIQILTEAKNEFLQLYSSGELTQEQLDNAASKFSDMIEIAESGKEIKNFSDKDADSNIIVAKKIFSNTQGLGRVTTIRLTLLCIGAGFTVIGLVIVIVYLKTGRSKKKQ